MIALTREEAQQVLDALKWFEQRFACTHLELIDTIRARLSAPEPARLGEIMPADEEQLKRIAKLVAPEPEPVAKLFGTLPVYETKQDGILTVTAPPQRVYCSGGDGIVPDDGALCGTCVSLKDAVKQEPVAWVENLTDAQPHAVTDLKYCSVAQHERGEHLKYIPLYADATPCQTCVSLARAVMMDQTSHDTAPSQREWQGLTHEELTEIIGISSADSDWNVLKVINWAKAIEAKLKEKNSG